MSKELQVDKGWRVWWKLTRPHTLTASFAPVFLGTIIALLGENGTFRADLFMAMLVASLLIQSATNMFNEYYDFKLGLDNEQSVGIGGTIVRNGVKPKVVLNIALAFYALSIIIGFYICYETSWWLAVVGIVSMAIGYLYTGGPFPIAYSPFGEVVSGFVMGMLLVLIAFFIQTGTVTLFAILLSIPSMLLVAAIMLSNNIRDIVQDTKGGRKTLAILIGRRRAINVLALLFIVSYVWITVLVFMQVITPWALIIWISVALPYKAIRTFLHSENPLKVAPAMKATAQTNTFFIVLLGIGLFIGYLTFY